MVADEKGKTFTSETKGELGDKGSGYSETNKEGPVAIELSLEEN